MEADLKIAGTARVPAFGYDHRRLNVLCVEIQRLRSKTNPNGAQLLAEALRELHSLAAEGMAAAKQVTPESARKVFVDQIHKIVGSAGITISPPRDEVARSGGLVVTANTPEWHFLDRLPRFTRKWHEDDPEWRLLEAAIMMVRIHTNVIGLAETREKDYLIFQGVAGGNYRTKVTGLFDGQKMMSVAYRRGYQAVPVKIFASKSDLNLLNHDYSVVRMINAPAKTPPQGGRYR